MKDKLDLLTDYPFIKVKHLLSDIKAPDCPNISLLLGEPHIPPTPQIAEIIKENQNLFSIYPQIQAPQELVSAFCNWTKDRFNIDPKKLPLENNVIPLCGSKEGIFMMANIADLKYSQYKNKNTIILPNPSYQVYKGATILSEAKAYFIDQNEDNNFQLDLSRVPENILKQTRAAYICNPSNPQGACMDLELIIKNIMIARQYDFIIMFDECYSEIYYTQNPPYGALDAIQSLDNSLDNVVIFFTLSKRSAVVGLRSAMMIADTNLIKIINKYRKYSAPVIPLPIAKASAFLWNDKNHVIKNREIYKRNVELFNQSFKDYNDYKPIQAGFFAWLKCTNPIQLTKNLYKYHNISVLPGEYLAETIMKKNVGDSYIRMSITVNETDLKTALNKITQYL